MIYRFGEFELDPEARLLSRNGQPEELPRRVFDCVLCLIERQPCAVSRDELIQRVWGRDNVSDNQLAQAVLRARRALGDSGAAPRHIGTVPGFGYRWLAPLQADPADACAPVEATVPAMFESASTSARHPAPRWLAAAAVLTLALGIAAWMAPGLHSGSAQSPPPNTAGMAVLPAQVEQVDRAGWARHGLMAVVTARLSEAGLEPLSLEQVLASLPSGAETDALTHKDLRRRLGGRSPIRILATPVEGEGEWRVELALEAEPPLQAQARHPDLIEASRLATDALLRALGHASPESEDGAALTLARRALHRHDFQGARLALARLSTQEREAPAAELLAIELDLATGQLQSAGEHIAELSMRLDPQASDFSSERLQLLQAQWQRASGQAIDAAQLQTLVETLEQRKAPPALLARALQARGSQALGSGRNASAAPDFARAHRLFLDAGEATRAASVSSNLAMLALLEGRHVEALEMLQTAAHVFRAEGDIGRLFNVLSSIDALQIGQLRWQDALAANDRAGALLPLIEDASARLSFYRRRAMIVLGLGRLDEAQALLERADQEAGRGEANPDSRARFGLYAAQFALARGDGAGVYAAALPVFEHVYARFGAEPEPQVRTDTRDLALQLMIQGLRLQALREPPVSLPALPEGAEATLDKAHSPLALVARGRWRELQGDHVGAEADLRAALAGAQAFNRLTRIYTATEALAELLVAQGRSAEAETVFLGLLSRDPSLPERDFDSAVLELRLKLATGDEAGIARARVRVEALAGQRSLPVDLQAPALRLSALGR